MEYEVVNVRLHPHPLLFEREGKCNGVCLRCRLPLLYEPSFRCSESDCNFKIHESCIHLPREIHSHFHPQHPLSLIHIHSSDCQACGQSHSLAEGYRCKECEYEIDIKCAIANKKLCETSNGKYVHISHPQHPLTLALSPQSHQNRGKIKKLLGCVVCELPIQSGSSTYFCSQCNNDDGHFHKECAELPIQRELPCHPHPLSLQNPGSWNILCHDCRNECKGFIYRCFECNFFNLHIPCLQSFNHKHTLTRLRHKIYFTCGICGERTHDRFVFLCDICHILVHEECVEFPLTLRIYEHEHHDVTYFKYFSPDVGEIHCKICGDKIDIKYGGYGCFQCAYFTHFKCAQGRCVESQSTAAEKESIEQHFNNIHPHHKLNLFAPKDIDNVEYKVCDGCMKCLSDSGPSYGCRHCDFFLHEECAELPTKINSIIHPPHSLTLISIPNFIFQCEACLQHFHGFAYQCQTCFSTFDVRCASIQTPFQHPNHNHSLYLYETNLNDDNACDACGKLTGCEKQAFRCKKCAFKLDLRCATLPVVVRYRFDQHALNLTGVEEERTEEYYCDICEEEREPGVGFYSCQKCRFKAHQRCVLGEFPFVKSAMHKSHKHPLNLVMMKDEGSRGCGACNDKSSSLNLAFQCGACKFNVHATGRCYDLQVLKGNLAFTNYNAFSRANQPYHNSIQKSLHLMKLGPFGSSIGEVWTESVFSSISGFVVYHSEYAEERIRCIQIQYPKNGELVWSKHGKEEGNRSEVSFDYPAEYLVSIHGTHRFDRLNSLTLETNRKTYGPFGVENEDRFSSVEVGVKIIGIFGITRDGVLRSIGFHGILTHE